MNTETGTSAEMVNEEPSFNHSGNGTRGINYDRKLSLKEIAIKIRAELKTKFPDHKFSIRTEYYSGGQSLHVSLMEAPFDPFKEPQEPGKGPVIYRDNYEYESAKNHYKYQIENGYTQVNCLFYHYITYEESNRDITKEPWETLKKVSQLIESFNFDDSDSMIDYFHVNFYTHINIGKWNKPFKNTKQGAN